MDFLDVSIASLSTASFSIENHISPLLLSHSTPCLNNANQNKDLTSPRVNGLLVHAINYNQSYSAIESVAKLLNCTPGRKGDVPATKYTIQKTIGGLFRPVFYIKCKRCSTYTATTEKETLCINASCQLSLNRAHLDYFVYCPLKVQLMKSLNDNFDKIMSYNASINESSDLIGDIHDAIQYKKLKERFPDSIILSLTANTDGARIYKSSNQSVWPLQLQQNFLSPNTRYIPENIITVAFHQGILISAFFYNKKQVYRFYWHQDNIRYSIIYRKYRLLICLKHNIKLLTRYRS